MSTAMVVSAPMTQIGTMASFGKKRPTLLIALQMLFNPRKQVTPTMMRVKKLDQKPLA